MTRNKFSDKDLQDIIDNLSEVSEDEFNLNDPAFMPKLEDEDENRKNLEENIREESVGMNNNQEEEIEEEVGSKSNKSKKEKVNIIWKSKILVLSDAQKTYRNTELLSVKALELFLPYECISNFFTNDLFIKITEQPCLSAHQIV
ncbi:hypothetical protein HHI36_017117 [Cryptolaemus montrouzieri]|uniref:Uncharacterized protein n=1 Tax=Cryptolaemus montrouzieri TaxID=559131 RepID=A0ABD2NMM7_9CUCU